jgi:Cu(I)/Ag(I) efflux system membrane fusion protein
MKYSRTNKNIISSNIFVLLVLILIIIGCNSKNEVNSSKAFYTCSMDPQIMENKPGKCPICKMELTKIEPRDENVNTLKFSESQLKLGNIKVDVLRKEKMSEEITISAKVTEDETKSSTISARIMGRVDDLSFKTIGEFIQKGELIYQLYSEDLSATQKDLLVAKERMQKLKDNIIDYKQIYLSTKNKLLLWGLTEKQISEIEKKGEVPLFTSFYSQTEGYITEIGIKEGDYLMQGQMIYKLNDLSTIWVEAQSFSTETETFKIGQEVKITFESMPEKTIRAKITFISPELSKNSQINSIRVQLNNEDNQFYPGMIATVTATVSQKYTLTLPLDAVLQEAKGSTVWIQNEAGTFENRMVETGMQNSKQIEILSGIAKGQKVVISGAYLINSEYRLKKGANLMEGHDMKGMKM